MIPLEVDLRDFWVKSYELNSIQIYWYKVNIKFFLQKTALLLSLYMEKTDIEHFRSPTSLHKRKVNIETEDRLLSKVSESYNAAQVRKFIPADEIESLHQPVTFSWRQFWISLLYESLPWVFISPIAALIIEKSRRKAWNVIQNRCLLLFSLKHNKLSLHIFFWFLLYPAQWLIIISLILVFFDFNNHLKSIDTFQVVIGYLVLTVRNLIISIKYGYYRPEDFEILNADPPDWTYDRTERRMVLAGWSNPKNYPGLIEDELTCTIDASNISVQGMSFKLKDEISNFLRNIVTDELFSAKTKYNKVDEVSSGFISHQILKKSFEINLPNYLFIIGIFCTIIVMISPLFFRYSYGVNLFGENIKENIILVGILLISFQSLPLFGFVVICIHDFSRRFTANNFLGKLIDYPGILLNDIIETNDNFKKDLLNKYLHVDLSIPKNVFAWFNLRPIFRSYGHGYYLRIQGYTSVFLCFVIFCMVMLNLIGWLGFRHHISTIFILVLMILVISAITIVSIFKASKLQHESSLHRNLIKKEILLIENALIEEDDSFNNLRKMKYKAKELLKEVDDYIDFEELKHNPTKILGFPADHNVLSSVIGLIITGFVLALEGFAGANIVYDLNGWYRY